MGNRQRSEAEWKFGMGKPSQNAFVSGWPKKAFMRCGKSFERKGQVGTGGWFPRRKITAKSGLSA